MTRDDRIAGGFWGLLVGDALGVPYEFHRASALPPRESLEMAPPPGFRRAHAGVLPGTWSDDGAQALCLLETLIQKKGFDARDFADRLLAWRRRGHLAVDATVFDIGVQTSAVLSRLERGDPLEVATATDERSNGNGSLMRTLPLALWHKGDAFDLVRDAHAQSRVTHGHPRSEVCVALYCLWAREELSGESEPWSRAVMFLRDVYRLTSPVHFEELERVVLPGMLLAPTGSGYVVDCLASARAACEGATYEEIVKAAIALGNDTDTTACVAGGIAGIRHGVSGIPERWRTALRGAELARPLLQSLLAVGGDRREYVQASPVTGVVPVPA